MAAAALAAFVAGAWLLQQQAELPRALALALLAMAAVAAAAVAARLRRRADDGSRGARAAVAALALAAAVAAGFDYAALRAHGRIADALAPADEGRDVVVVGVVDSLPAPLERGQRFEFAVERVLTPDVQVPARVALAWYGATALRPAERWQFTVRLRRPHGNLNPHGFDLEAWMLERGLRASGYVREARGSAPPQRLDAWVADPGANVDRARAALRERLAQRLDGTRYGGVLIALVLGDQRAVAESDWQLANATGISHLLSISGLHITMLAGLAAALVSLLWRRVPALLARAPAQSAAAVAGLLAAFAYCLLAGWGVPAQRTFFMLAVVALALLARVPATPTRTLALAAAAVTLIDPWASQAPGFWLSFGAVAAIFYTLAAARPADRGWRAWLREAVKVQMAVTLALLPLTIALFQQASLLSPLANAVAIPLVSLVVTPLALIAAAVTLLPAPFDALATPGLALGEALVHGLMRLLQAMVDHGGAALALPAPPPWALAFAAAGVLWLLAPRGWPLRALGLLWLAPLFVWPAPRPAAGELWVDAIDVGQGAAVLLQTREATLLYDAGPRYGPQADAGSRVIAPYLRARGIDRLLLVVSHLDSDHSGGAASLLRALPGTPVLTSIDPQHPMLREAAAVTRCAAGQRIALGALTLTTLHPTAAELAAPRNTNAASCVLLVEFAGLRLLLTGDLPAREEQALLARHPLAPVDWMTAPHHGSRHSSSPALVAAARPRWVLFQAGYRNRFGHPDAGVVGRYLAAGANVARNDHGGMIRWRLRGGDLTGEEVSAARQALRRYWHNQPGPGLIAAVTSAEAAPGMRRSGEAVSTSDSDPDRDDDPAAAPPAEASAAPEAFGP